MLIGFKELYQKLTTKSDEGERLRYAFIRRASTAESFGHSPGEKLFPDASPSFQMAIDDLSLELLRQHEKEQREKEEKKRKK